MNHYLVRGLALTMSVWACAGPTNTIDNAGTSLVEAEPNRLEDYVELAEAEDLSAQIALGRLYFKGNETTARDPEQSAYWARRVVLAGDSEHVYEAMVILFALRQELLSNYPSLAAELIGDDLRGTVLFKQGRIEDGVALLIGLAQLFDVESQLLLETLYASGWSLIAAHHPKILAYYEAAAAEGIPRASLYLAKIQYYGWGVERDPTRAVETARSAAGLHESYEFLGAVFFEAGREDEAIELWETGAEMGNASSAYELGVSYREREDYDRAVKAFELAIELDSTSYRAMANLGQIYMAGWGGKLDLERGFAYYKRAADEAGEEIAGAAQFLVGLYYRDGTGVSPSKELAVKYLQLAAAKGFEDAQFHLDAMP